MKWGNTMVLVVLFIYVIFMYLCSGEYMFMWKLEDNLGELVFLFYYVGFED